MPRLFLFLLLLPTLLAQKPRSAADLRDALAKIDALVGAEAAQSRPASVTVGVVSGPGLVWTKSYGLARIEDKTPASPDTVYRIGSITKQFTAVMLLQLVEQGKVHLSDPVEKYFPEVNRVQGRFPDASPITLLQLATHTSGLDREPDDLPTYLIGPVAEWEKVLLASLPHLRYRFEPGTRFFYSNIGYAILGAALARAAGEPYTDYVRRHILAPLGMTHTDFEPTPAMRAHLARGYLLDGGRADPTIPDRELRTGRGYKVPNGALFTTVGDLAKFLAFESGAAPSEVLKKETMRDNLSRAYSVNGALADGYGIGFSLVRNHDLIVAGHGGSVAGFSAGAYFNPPSQAGIIFLRNVIGPGFGNTLVFQVLYALTQ